jgi:hypothetical protein
LQGWYSISVPTKADGEDTSRDTAIHESRFIADGSMVDFCLKGSQESGDI